MKVLMDKLSKKLEELEVSNATPTGDPPGNGRVVGVLPEYLRALWSALNGEEAKLLDTARERRRYINSGSSMEHWSCDPCVCYEKEKDLHGVLKTLFWMFLLEEFPDCAHYDRVVVVSDWRVVACQILQTMHPARGVWRVPTSL